MSAKCRPVVGSSRIYKVRPVSRLESSSASLTRWASLPERVVADVAEADVHQGLQFARYGEHGVEEFLGFFYGHVQHLADVFAFVLHFEGFAVVAFTVV